MFNVEFQNFVYETLEGSKFISQFKWNEFITNLPNEIVDLLFVVSFVLLWLGGNSWTTTPSTISSMILKSSCNLFKWIHLIQCNPHTFKAFPFCSMVIMMGETYFWIFHFTYNNRLSKSFLLLSSSNIFGIHLSWFSPFLFCEWQWFKLMFIQNNLFHYNF